MADNLRPRAQELFKQMAGGQLYRRAYEEGMTLSAWLEEQDPSAEYKDGLDAFSRQIAVAGIAVRSEPMYGIWADEFGAFDQDDNARALVPEWIARQFRAVAYGQRPDTSRMAELRAIFLSSDQPINSLARPYADDPTLRVSEEVTPAIPLASLVARTTGIDSNAYRAFYLTRDASALRFVRVGEGGEIPRAKLVGGERTIDLFKFGRALETSYESLRRMRIDLLGFYLRLLAVQAEVDKVAAAIDVLVNGDGNAGTTPETVDLTTLDAAAVAGTLTLKGWINFKMEFENPYMLTTMLGRRADLLQAFLLQMGSANVPLVTIAGAAGFGGFTPINPGLRDNVEVGWTTDAPSQKFVAFDRRMALEHVTEIGADIQEVERYVTRQTQVLAMTTVDGFRILDANAVKILDINA